MEYRTTSWVKQTNSEKYILRGVVWDFQSGNAIRLKNPALPQGYVSAGSPTKRIIEHELYTDTRIVTAVTQLTIEAILDEYDIGVEETVEVRIFANAHTQIPASGGVVKYEEADSGGE